MEKTKTLNREQEIILDEVIKSKYITDNFYITGGTALSEFYLKHRYSEDLDFFTADNFNKKNLIEFIRQISKSHDLTYRLQGDEYVLFFTLTFRNGKNLKVDFAKYPYPTLSKVTFYKSLKIDSLLDIAVNKLSMIPERAEVKDYTDLYFILKNIPLWDLIAGVKVKFKMDINPFLLASDFTKAEKFTFMPKMIKPLSLSELKSYFLTLAETLAKKSTK